MKYLAVDVGGSSTRATIVEADGTFRAIVMPDIVGPLVLRGLRASRLRGANRHRRPADAGLASMVP